MFFAGWAARSLLVRTKNDDETSGKLAITLLIAVLVGLFMEGTAVSWSYNGGDAGICLFDACLKAGAPLTFRPGMRILEVGCCESDWLERAAAAWPECEFVGIDVNAKDAYQGNWQRWKADARQIDLLGPASFDAVVSISAIEHIGLGHYGDPKDEDGDCIAVQNIWKWIKPNGWFYFDVPYDPTGYRVLNTECRIYDDMALADRFTGWKTGTHYLPWFSDLRVYADAKAPGTLIDKPTVAAQRYYYAANLWRKA